MSFYLIIAKYLMNRGVLFSFFSAFGFFLMPFLFKNFQKWQESCKANEFSIWILQGMLSLLFLISAFLLFVAQVIEMSSFFAKPIYGILVSILLIYVAYGWSIPRMLTSYNRLKLRKAMIYRKQRPFNGSKAPCKKQKQSWVWKVC